MVTTVTTSSTTSSKQMSTIDLVFLSRFFDKSLVTSILYVTLLPSHRTVFVHESLARAQFWLINCCYLKAVSKFKHHLLKVSNQSYSGLLFIKWSPRFVSKASKNGKIIKSELNHFCKIEGKSKTFLNKRPGLNLNQLMLKLCLQVLHTKTKKNSRSNLSQKSKRKK